MKISINIEKKHLIFFVIFLIVAGIGISIATTYDNSQSHTTLWTTEIKGKNVAAVSVRDDLTLDAGKKLKTNTLTTTSGLTLNVGDSSSITAYVPGSLNVVGPIKSTGTLQLGDTTGDVLVAQTLNLRKTNSATPFFCLSLADVGKTTLVRETNSAGTDLGNTYLCICLRRSNAYQVLCLN